MVHNSVPHQALLFAVIAVVTVLEFTAADHFRGAIIQWRPEDPVNFDGKVSLRIAYDLGGAKCKF